MPIIASFSALPARALGLANFVVSGSPTITAIDDDANGVTGTVADVFFTPGTIGTTPVTNYEYSLDSGSTWTAFSPAALTSPLRITGLTNGTTYQVAIRASQDGIPSPASNVVSVRPVALPGAPTITAAAGNVNGTTGTQVQISFTAGTAGTDANTDFEYRIGSGSWVSAGLTSPFTVTGLTNGTTYSFTLRAKMGSYLSNASSAVNGRPRALPGAPNISSITGSTGQLSIAFSAGTAGTDATSTYQVSLNNGSTWANRASGSTGSPLVVAVSSDKDVVDGVYDDTVRIRAVTSQSDVSAQSNTTIPSHNVPGAPPVPTVTATATSLAFSWSASTAGAYAISKYQWSSNNSTWNDVGSTATERSVTFSGLAPSTSYTRYFRAVDVQGQVSAARTSTNSTSAEIAPSAPAAPTVSAGSTTSLSVDWSSGTAGTYSISKHQYRSRVSGGTYGSATDITDSADPFTISTLSVDTTYDVQIRAVATSGAVSAWSTAGSGATNPNVPDAPTLSFRDTNASERSVAKLQWTAPSYAAGYHLYQRNPGGGGETFIGGYTSTTADVSISAGTSKEYYVYAYNRIAEFSAASNLKTMTAGQENVYGKGNILEFGPDVWLASNAGCPDLNQGRIVGYWGSVPSSSSTAGWKKVETIGYQVLGRSWTSTTCLGSRSIFINVSEGGVNGNNTHTLCVSLTTGSYSLAFKQNLNISGSSLNNSYITLNASPNGTGWSGYLSNCTLSGDFYLPVRNLFWEGKQTTPSTYS